MFLLRQYQLGEVTGSDGGTPVAIDIAASWSRFSRYRAEGRVPAGESVPIEAVVEREPVIRLGADTRGTPWTAAVRAGRSLRRQLTGELAAVATRIAADPAFLFTAHTGTDQVEGADDARYRVLLADRAIDGVKVLALHLGGGLPADIVADADPVALGGALAEWESELRREWGVAGAGDPLAPAWVRDRLEYAFSIAAPPLPGEQHERVFTASEYAGTGLQWSSLDLARGGARRHRRRHPGVESGRQPGPHPAPGAADLPGHARRPVLGTGRRVGGARPGGERPDGPRENARRRLRHRVRAGLVPGSCRVAGRLPGPDRLGRCP